MLEYRRLKGEERWHWCTHCPHWPTDEATYDCLRHEEPEGHRCQDCEKLDTAGQCAPIEEPQPRPIG